MRVSLKAVAGVETVDVSLEKGLASVRLKPGNATTLKQLQGAITKNGFTMKASKAIVAGTVQVTTGKTQLKVLGSNDVLDLFPESQSSVTATSMQTKAVVAVGTIAEAQKGKVPDSLTYISLAEESRR